jgi:CelD/BcsL family acetyltransferase involved in cellulose biosynthesis
VHGALPSLRTEWRPLAALAPIAAQWRALAARALEPNVFYEPAFALAAAPVFGAEAGAVVVSPRDAGAGLLGIFPARIEPRRYGIKLPVLVGWTHPYAPLGAPLIDRDYADAVIDAWLGHMAGDARLPKLALMPFLPLQGPLAAALDSAIERHGGRAADFARHARALLHPAAERGDYLKRTLGAKTRKNLRHQRNLLARIGAVRLDRADLPATIGPALTDFLALEEAGWKGRAGTAIAQHADTSCFVHGAIAALAEDGRVQIYRLMLGERAIAAGILLRSEASAWFWKTAFDEAFARASPGLHLGVELTQTLLKDESLVRVDSCAVADHPMIDRVWRERLAIGDRLLSVGGAPFTLARAMESSRRAAAAGVRALRDRIVRR